MKKTLLFILVIVLGFVIWKNDEISQFIVQKIIFKDQPVITEPNEYYKKDDFILLQNTDSFMPKSKEEFNNIIYTILNKGWNSFSFFCDIEYKSCVDDFNDYIQNSDYVEVINNYVHPFNSFNNISITTNSFNKITIDVEDLYNDEQIKTINSIINDFINNNITDNMNEKDKIKTFHDWIINNAKYDSIFSANTNKETYPTHPYNAYGVLVEGKGICGGYSDAMAIFLNAIGIKNYKIFSNEHIWNYAFVNNNWYHLDLTWDDPVTSDNSDLLIYDFFLISTKELENKETKQHEFDKSYYLEVK